MSTIICKVLGAVFLMVALVGMTAGQVAGDKDAVLPAHGLLLLAGTLALAAGYGSLAAARLYGFLAGLVFVAAGVYGLAGPEAIVRALRLEAPAHYLNLLAGLMLLAGGFADGHHVDHHHRAAT